MTELLGSVNRWDGLVFSGVVALIFVLAWRRYPIRGTLVAAVAASISFASGLVFPFMNGVVYDGTTDSVNQMSLISAIAGVASLTGAILLIVALRRLIGAAEESMSGLENEGDVQ